MGELNNKSKQELKDNITEHLAPDADPGAQIETVIPSTESTEVPAAPDQTEKQGDTPAEPSEEPEVAEEEQDEIEATEDQEESSTDEHGIETVSP